MREKLEAWLFNIFVGKMVARLAITIVAYVASAKAQALLHMVGLTVTIDQAELTTGMIAGSHAAYEWIKARRMANPSSPAVQTDASKPGAELSAAAMAPKA